jgi:hypothetical protein
MYLSERQGHKKNIHFFVLRPYTRDQHFACRSPGPVYSYYFKDGMNTYCVIFTFGEVKYFVIRTGIKFISIAVQAITEPIEEKG